MSDPERDPVLFQALAGFYCGRLVGCDAVADHEVFLADLGGLLQFLVDGAEFTRDLLSDIDKVHALTASVRFSIVQIGTTPVAKAKMLLRLNTLSVEFRSFVILRVESASQLLLHAVTDCQKCLAQHSCVVTFHSL